MVSRRLTFSWRAVPVEANWAQENRLREDDSIGYQAGCSGRHARDVAQNRCHPRASNPLADWSGALYLVVTRISRVKHSAIITRMTVGSVVSYILISSLPIVSNWTPPYPCLLHAMPAYCAKLVSHFVVAPF
jgi:hypothetical protein